MSDLPIPVGTQRLFNHPQLALGMTFLFAGLCIYVFDRNIFPILGTHVNRYASHGSIHLGWVSGFFPSFFHAAAFCLLTAAVFNGGRRACLWVCSFWAFTDALFELGQNRTIYSYFIMPLIQPNHHGLTLRYLDHYFSTGTFDIMDMVFVMLGCIVAQRLILSSCAGKTD